MTIRAEVEGIGTLEFPDGTDPAVIRATAIKLAQTPEATRARVAAMKSSWAATNPMNQIGNVARGAVDVIGGGAQLLSRGANALGMVPESNPDGLFAGPKDVEAQNAQARQNIDSVFGKQDPGFVSGAIRAGSSGLLTMPLAPTKFLQAPTLLQRAAGGGIAGAEAGALQDVPNAGDNTDFAKKKLLQTGAGFAGGVIAQPIAEKVVQTVVSGLNYAGDKGMAALRNASGANSMDNLVAMTRAALKSQGLDFDAIGEQAKASLLNDVQTALKSYSGTSPGAIARQAAFRQEGFDPLRHWITRDPSEFTAIENLSHTDAGGQLKQRKNDLDKLVMERMTGMRGEQRLPEDVGKAAMGDLSAYMGQENGKTNVLYDTFRDIAPNINGNPQRFANDVFGGLEGKMNSAALPEHLRGIVNQISSGEIPLTPSVLFQLQKMLKPGADGSANNAMKYLSGAIDREMNAISQTVGTMDRSMPVPMGQQAPSKDSQYAASVLKMARGQAAKVFGEMEGSKILRGVDEGTLAPENFGDILFGSSVKELSSTWGKLAPESQAEVRAQVMDMLKTKAFGGASEASGKAANQATLNNFLSDATNAQKLKMILGDDKFQAVKRLALMVESATSQPSGSAVNNSKTGGALLTAFPKIAQYMKAGNIPGNSAVQSIANGGLAENAMYVPAESLGQRSQIIDPFVEEILKRRAGHGSALLGGSAAFPALQSLLVPQQ